MLVGRSPLTHWGRVTHICVSELTIIGSDNGLSPGRRQAIIWNNAGLLLSEPLGTNVSEISIGIQTFTFKKMHLNMSSAKWRPFFLGLNVLRSYLTTTSRRGRACARRERINNATFWWRGASHGGHHRDHHYDILTMGETPEPILGPDIRRWNLRVPDPQMNRSDPTQRR